MIPLKSIIGLASAALLCACAATPATPTATSDKITLTEAKTLACPESVLKAGASPEDCRCVENKLFEIGQRPGAIQYDNAPYGQTSGDSAPQAGFGGADGKREIAIGLLRLEAFEHCGFFDPDHIVSKNLQSERLTVR